MKKYRFVLVLLLLLLFPLLVMAEESQANITEQVIQEKINSPKSLHKPISVDRKNQEGNEYIIKTYEVATSFDPSLLIENGFEQDGFLFAHLSTDMKENEKKETKVITESVTIETQTDNKDGILKRLPISKGYDKEGFKGTLELNKESILTKASAYTTKSYTVSTIKEYPGLMYADPSYVPQTAVKDGHTLPLVNVDWSVMGTGLAGDTLVPTEYKATASYSKNISNKVATSYITTANYAGTVTKSSSNSVFYTITYVGTPIYIQPNEAPKDEININTNLNSNTNLNISSIVLWSIIFALAIAGGAAFLFVFLKHRNGIQVYNFIDKEYLNIGEQVIDIQKPIVDLNEFKDLLQSNSFAFVLDKPLTKKLYGRNIAVTLDDVTVKHMVKGYNEQYRFNLEFGGVLDVE